MENKKNEKKLGAQRKFINKNKNGRILVGTTNKKDCRAAYIRIESWVTPEDSLETSIGLIRRRFLANIYRISKIYFEDFKSSIIDYDYNQTKGTDKSCKTSFISIEITLLAISKFNWDSDFIFTCENFGNTMFDLLDSLDEHFIMTLTNK